MHRVSIVLVLISLSVCPSKATSDISGENSHSSKTPWQSKDIKGLLNEYDMTASWNMIQQLPQKDHGDFNVDDLPTNFDARNKWPGCASIKEIRDQGECGSHWAIGAVTAMSDRICIKSGGQSQVHLSTQNLVTCCKQCGDGCQKGFPPAAWHYYQNTGIVSGGRYGSNKGCQPYKFSNCDHWDIGRYRPCHTKYLPTPSCNRKCREGYSKSYQQDLYYGKSTYSVRGVENIMKELVENGPVEAVFNIYRDFLLYRTGVYRHKSGHKLGGHAVKILGYGVEEGVKYWLVANSWNEDWGDRGYFKILRGSDECGIESQVVAGEPLL